MAFKLVELKHNLEAEKIVTTQASQQIADQQARIQDLQGELARSQQHVQTLAEANKQLSEQAKEQQATHQDDLKVAYKYGLIKALQADPGLYDLEAEQAALEELEGGAEEEPEPEPESDVGSMLNVEATAENAHLQKGEDRGASGIAEESQKVVGDA